MSYKQLKERMLLRPSLRRAYNDQRYLNRLGSLLQRSREQFNLSQQLLAEAAGINQADISRIEAGLGTRGPTFDTLLRLAHAQRMKLVVELVPEDQADLPNEPQRLREAF